jgi:hypothetical protein
MNTPSDTQPQHLLSPLGAVALIVGIVIGAGIFKTPAMVAGIAGDVTIDGGVERARADGCAIV